MRTTLIGRWLEKNNKPFVALLAAGATLAIAMLVDASSSPQVEQVGQMAIHRSAHKATALSDGRVLITGGRNTAGIVIADAEIFDPNTDESSAVAPMATARVDHTATLLKDGRVLITGGSNATGTLSSAEIFDPSTGTFSAVNGGLNMARARHTATLLSSGKVLIAGGDVTPTLVDPNGTDVTGTAEMFDPSAGTFGDLVLLQRSRSGHTATLFSNDKVWLAGGGNNTIESFDATAGAFTLSDTAMTAVRSGHEAFALSSTSVLFFGGDANHTIYQFNPSTGELSLVDQMNSEASSATLLANSKILVLRSDVAGLYDPAGAFIAFDEATMPNSTLLLRSGQSATEVTGDKRILIAGGEKADHQPALQIAIFNPAKIWTDKDDYVPDEPVILSGSGWKANENIYLYAVDNETEQWTYEMTVPADANGGFILDPYFIVELRHLGVQFHVTALGAQSTMQAGVYFTDAINLNSVTVGSQTGTLTYGTAGSANYSVCISYNGNNSTISFSVISGLPSGVTASFSANNINNPVKCPTTATTLTLTTTAAVPAGDYTFTVKASNGGTANGDNVTTTGTLHIGKANATVVVTPYTVTYDGNPHTATVTSITGVNGETGATVGTVTLNTTHTAVGTYSSDTWSFTGTANYNNIAATAITDVIQKATPTATLAVTNSPQTYNGSPQAATVGISASSVPGTVQNILTGGSATKTNAGTYAVTADFVPTDTANYNTLTGLSAGNFIINKATPTATLSVTNSPQTYTGLGQAATVGITTSSVPGTVANILTGGSATKTNAGTYAVTADFVPNDTTNYNTLTGLSAGNFIIQKANATFTVTPYTCPTTTYTGLPHTAAVSTITGVNGETGATVGTVNVIDTMHTNVGIYNGDPWTFTGTANYNNTSGTVDDCIAKADATVVVTPYTCPTATYTGLPHTATYTITGVNGETGATVGTINVSGTTHTPAGTYNNDPWSFTGGANYNDTSGTVNDCIAKANATVVVTPYTCPSTTYTGFAHTATYTITGVNGETGATVGGVNVSGTSHTAAGTYNNDPWSFTGTANYEDQNGTVNDCIAKAAAVVVVTPYTCPSTTYTGFAHTATYTITGVNGETGATVGGVNVSGTSHTAAGTYNNDPWSFTGTANYEDQNGTVNDCIAKADATFTVTAYSVTYNGNPHTATISTITGVNGETGATVGAVNVTGTIHTDAGTYNNDPWSFTGTANYNNQSGTVDDYIGKADATFTVTAYSVTYNGNPHTATISTITGVNGETGATVGAVNVTGTIHTDAGTYNNDPWSFTGTANYNNQSGTVDDYIGKADATFTVTAYSVTYNGNPHTATISTITGVNGETGATVGAVNVTGTIHTDAGTYNNDPWSFTGTANYNNQSGTVDDYIGKADATFTVTAYSVTYNGNPHTATVSTITGVNGETGATVGAVNVTGTIHTDAGTYNNDPWSFTGTANYNNQSGTVDDYIGKADATFTVTAYSVTYNGNPHTATISTITGVNGETGATVGAVNVTGTIHTNAGTYNNDPWSFTGTANYNNQSGTVDDYIDRADATVVVAAYTCPTTTYTGLPHTATVVSITGVNGETGATVGTVDVSNTTHTNVGTYAADYWFFTGAANYNNIGNTTIGDCIAKAHLTVTADDKNRAYGAANPTFTAAITGFVNGETIAVVSGSPTFSGTGPSSTATTTVGDYVITPAVGTLSATNYDFTPFVNGTLHITQAHLTVTAQDKSRTYGAVNPTFTAAITGFVNGETIAVVSGSPTFSGTGPSSTATTTVGDYVITPAVGTLSATNYDFTPFFNGTLHITQAHLTVTAQDKSRTYGAANPTFTAAITGFVNGETIAVVSGSPTFSGTGPSSTATTSVGNYVITPALGTLSATNYDFTPFINGTLHITTAILTITADSMVGTPAVDPFNKAYDGLVYTGFTVRYSGFVNGETLSVLGGSLTFSGTGTTATLPGTYTVTPGGLTSTNYAITFNNGTLNIGYGTCNGSDPGGVILPPINADGSSVYKRKAGSTIPVKFTVCGANGQPISNPAAVFLNYPQGGQLTMTGQIRGTVDQVNETGDTTIPDVAFSFTGGQWHFNMDTGNLTAGNTYTFRINLAFGPGIMFTVGTK